MSYDRKKAEWNAMSYKYKKAPLKYAHTMIAYDGNGGAIEVGLHPDPFSNGWSSHYELTFGACWADWNKGTKLEKSFKLLLEFHRAVVWGNVPVKKAHLEFWKIDLYREMMDDDIFRETLREIAGNDNVVDCEWEIPSNV